MPSWSKEGGAVDALCPADKVPETQRDFVDVNRFVFAETSAVLKDRTANNEVSPMPTYEYRCSECGQHVEVVQSFSAEPLTVCGACRGPLKKVFGSLGIIFKGSGSGDAPEVAESPGSSGKAAGAAHASTV